MTPPELAVVGRIRKPHGIQGEVMVDLATDDPDTVFVRGRRLQVGAPDDDATPLDRTLTVRSARAFKDGLLVHFAEIVDRSDADAWRAHHLLAPLAELAPPEPGALYYHEFEGMAVIDAAGTPVGTVVAFYELPQGIMLEVARAAGEAVLIPYRHGIVTAVDRDGRRIVVDPPAGLLE